MYSKDDVYSATLLYFNGDDLAAKVWVDKYCLKKVNKDGSIEYMEKTPDDMHRRLAQEFAWIEAKYVNPLSFDDIYALFEHYRYVIPQGSPMAVIGNPYQVSSVSNCVVLPKLFDSYGGILYADQQLAQLCKRRCGVGLNISPLRPKKLPVNNSALNTSGIEVFMERFSNTIREVGQDGRRGALMIIISVHHPQILDFVKIKNDLKKVTGANISVFLTNEFLDAVGKRRKYQQRWPVDSKSPQVSMMVDAYAVWMEIINNAWAMAEPGLLFEDMINDYNPATVYEGFETIATNPCRPVWATVLTPNGISTIGQIKPGDKIWSKEGWTTVLRKWSTGVKKVCRYGTTAAAFYGTSNHHIISHGVKVEAQHAESIDVCVGPYDNRMIFDEQAIMDGLVLGDGTVHKASNNLLLLCIGKKDHDYFTSEIAKLIGRKRNGIGESVYNVKTTLTPNELPKTYLRKVPNRFVYANKNIVCSFLRGLFSANGTVVGERVCLKASSFDIIEKVQLMLSSVGIRSYYTTNKESVVRFKNGDYVCKQSYDVNIGTDRHKFFAIIGFIQKYKMEKLWKDVQSVGKGDKPKKLTYDIREITFVSEEEVFDITVDNGSHTYWSDGCDVSNCAEITMNNDTCRLITQNLTSFVENPFTRKAEFNYKRWSDNVYKAMRLSDDMVDIEVECMDRIIAKVEADPEPDFIKDVELRTWRGYRENALKGRRTGLGITALGDAIAMMGFKYGSNRSIEFADAIFKEKKRAEYLSSIHLAKERKPFPIYDYEKEKDNKFIKQLFADCPELQPLMKKYGRRNIAIATSAPNGTVSTQTQTTSGIEPAFMLQYIRRRKINDNDLDAKVDFVDQMGDKWQHFTVYHHGLQKWMEITGKTNIEDSPYHEACAEDLDWVQRVKLQATIQKHIDHSISSTLNLPENVTPEQVAEIYETAWKAECKGITVYRKNCRTGVLVEQAKSNDAISHVDAPKRPKELPCDIFKVMSKGREYCVAVGLLNGQPYEVLAAEQGNREPFITKSCEGYIAKVSRGIYTLTDQNREVLCRSITDECSDEEEAITRLVSTSLRHGASIAFVQHQLSKVKGDMNNFARVLARVLKKYVKDGTKVHGESCPQCKGESLVRQEGCVSCSCGYSKCS